MSTPREIRDEITEVLAKTEYYRVTKGTGAPTWEGATNLARNECVKAIRERVTDVLDLHGYLPMRRQSMNGEKWRWVGRWNNGKAPE